MKTTAILRLFAVLSGSAFAIVLAQDSKPDSVDRGPDDSLRKLVRVQVEFIEVPHPTLTRLLAEPEVSANHGELRTSLADLAEKGEARIYETLIVTTRSGQKALTQSNKEFIFPTEYENPEFFPNSPWAEGEDNTVGSQLVGYTPTSFENRCLGSTLEAEPKVSNDGLLIDLRIVPEIVYHTGNETWSEWKDERGDASVRMPTFYTARIHTAVTLIPGQPLFVAALSPKEADSGMPDNTRKLMVFVRCDVITVGR